MRRAGAGAALFALTLAGPLGGCSGEPDPAPAPTPVASVAVPPPVPVTTRSTAPGELPAPELDGAVPLNGTWRMQASATGSAASYTGADGAVRFAVRCDPQARRILLLAAGGAGAMRVVTRDAAATFPTDAADGGGVAARLTTGQTFLDALARAETFGVAVGEAAMQRLPGDAAIGQVVRSCRPGG